MKKFNTDYVLSNAIADPVTYWLNSCKVPRGKFPPAMWEALEAQENIGWIHLFCGKLSRKWLLLYDSRTPPDQREIFNKSYLWGAVIIETILWQYIELW